MANFQIPAPPSGKRPVDTYQWLGKILEALNNTKGVDWHTNNNLTIKELGDSIGNDRNFVSTVDNKIIAAFQPVPIKASTDLNTLTTTGLYTSDSDGNTQTITNKPTGITTGFILQVYPIWGSGTSKRLVQLLYSHQNGVLYMRSKAEDDVWSPWINVITSADVTSSNTANKVVQRDASGNFSAGTITASLNGNAKTATTLQTARTINGTSFNGSANITTANWGTARTITIGSTGKSVNGSGNVSWSLSEIGAAAASHTHTSSQITDATNANTVNMIVKRDASGNFSAGTITASLSGNASTATTLQTARTINGTSFNGSANITTANWGTARTLTIGNTGKSVNGSANVSWSLSEIGAVPHVKCTTVTDFNNIKTTGIYSCAASSMTNAPTTNHGTLIVDFNVGTPYQIWIPDNSHIIYKRTYTTSSSTWSTWSSTLSNSISGNSATATKLATARTINGTSFDGSANITTANWGTARNVTIGSTKKSVNGSADVSWSLSEIGAAAASHTHTSSQITDATNANTANMIVKRDGSGNFSAGTITASLSGNATTATTLQTARTINGTSFNGSANITTANWGTARTITIGSTGKSVNGSANVSWSLSEIGAEEYQKLSATTAATAQWYRIAQTTSTDQNNTLGLFHIKAECNSRHSTTLLNAGITYGQNPTLVQLAHTQYSVTGISKARIVYHTTYSGNRAYLEVYVPDANARTITVQLAGTTGWTLVAPSTVGSIPSGYTNTEIALANNRLVGQLNGNASTATTLQTARTINGTSFDGTANITTANWGTARNITIGNTTRSVNGSSNVSWSLSEIGAAAASHTHSYLPLSGGTITGSINYNSGTWSGTAIHLGAGDDSNGAYIGIGAGGLTIIGGGESTSTVRGGITNGSDERMIVASDQSIDFMTGLQSGFDSRKTVSISAAGVLSAPYGITGSLSGNASTATTLQTARTINGTSFNGSANITTANWGTARTITIGNTGKSVNGSGNVSWSLSEIGAPKSAGDRSFGGDETAITTTQFIELLTASGAFDDFVWISRGSWSYANNRYINDTGLGNIHLAGCVVEVIGYSSAYTIRIHTPTTSSKGTVYGDFIYVNNGSNYNPGWRRLYNTSYKPKSADITDATNANTANMIVKRDASGNFIAGTITASLSGNATTATTLQTARTINGTSFNGSANITTANWGTARTLTIGNTGKSVNGSANVSWSLSEIGAAAASHTHNSIVSRGNVTAESDTTVPAVSGLSMTQAYNNGYPIGYGNVMTMRGSGSSQLLVGWSGTSGANEKAYIRSKRDTSDANWSSWAQIYTSAHPQTTITGNAGTATKLATARTINGTSFDGSANITTANWGAARTLTIGNTGKSVNGSGNVSWSLSEIGAAAASHTHSNYVPTTDYTLTTITKTLTITTSWQDTGITGTNLKTGSYMIQVSGMSSDATGMYSEIFTGVMSWTDVTTNSADYDEIILHKAGHASNGRAIYLRTIRSSSSGYLKLQIAASTNFTSSSVTFKFRKLI